MKKILLFALTLTCLSMSYAQKIVPDVTFGNNGIVATDMGSLTPGNIYASQTLLSKNGDGKIYVLLNTGSTSFITRRMTNGTIDSTYGLNGYSKQFSFNTNSAVLQNDDKIVVIGNGRIFRLKTTGVLDTSFGINGMQSITANVGPSAVAIQNDGKIVVAGSGGGGAGVINSFALLRYNVDGTLDNSFNAAGLVTVDFPYKIAPPRGVTDSITLSDASATCVLIQSDGKIVVGGQATSGTGKRFAIARFNLDGGLDSSFGVNGKQTTKIPSDGSAYSIVQQTDEKIILGGDYGYSGYDVAVVRYNKNGFPDTSFNSTGIQVLTGLHLATNSMALQTTGKIIMSGYAASATINDFATARLNTDGSLDNSFGVNGILLTDIDSAEDRALCVVTDKNDRILLTGYAVDPAVTNSTDFALVRYNSNGALDNSFAEGGKLHSNIGQGNTTFTRTAVQNDGKVIAAGTTWNGSNYDFAVVRYNIDGTLDKTFNNSGKQVTDFGGNEEVTGLVIQADGKIIVAGDSYDNINPSVLTVARYTTNGLLDSSYNNNGKQTVLIGTGAVLGNIALQVDGKLVLAGYSFTGFYDTAFFAIARLTVDGILDITFNGTGTETANFNGGQSEASTVAMQNDGKIVIAGWTDVNGQRDFALARYNTNGSPDTSFSHDGQQTSAFGADDYNVVSMTIQKDEKIVLAGYGESADGSMVYTAMARYNMNGDPDNGFGIGGSVIGSPLPGFPAAVAINANGTIALAGNYAGNGAVVFFKDNGAIDSTFGNNGVYASPIGLSGSSFNTLQFSTGYLYAAGWALFPGHLGIVVKLVTAAAGPLPVKLIDFTASAHANKTALLQWQTASEENLAGFGIERSVDGNIFSPIGFVTAAGNSNVKLNYSTIDQHPFTGLNYYRLKLTDMDGKFSYSNVAAVQITGNGFNLKASPNPAKNILFVQAGGNNEPATLRVTDLNGRILSEVQISLNGNTTLQLNISNLAAGMYNLQLLKKSGTETKRFIKE